MKRVLKEIAAALSSLSELPIFARAGTILNRLAEAGTQGYPLEIKRRLMILNMIAYLVAASTLVYAIQHSFLDYEKYKPVIWINIALVGTALLVPFSHRYSEIAGGLIIVLSEFVALIFFTMYLGRSAGPHLQYFIAAAAPFVVFGLKRLWLIVPIIIGALILHLASFFWFPRSEALIDAERAVLDSIYVQAAITTFGLIAASVYYAFRLAENAKAETDNLLRNILPDAIVERLKLHPNDPIADTFSDAAVMFADISGFVALARRLGAGPTVGLLNEIVTEFDTLSDRHGVEKIKTIGDAYMVAAGIPQPVPNPVERLANMALDMQRAVDKIAASSGHDIAIRVGLASGPVMAGVIGKQKFTYDVWGDAVNLASRLEALSKPGRILVCPRCKAALEPMFTFEARELADIKGVGEQQTWFLGASRGNRAAAE